VAAKTGTTETGAQTEDAVFICYAPADDPEIAIAVVVEKGKRGANLANIAKQVLDYYFDFEQSTQQVENELTLLH
jgi:penicillin-binding protein 2